MKRTVAVLVSLLLASNAVLAMSRNIDGLILPSPANSSDLEVIGHIGGESYAVVVQGNYAFLGLGPEMAIIDVATPATPRRIGYAMLPGFVKDIAVVGNYAYVTWNKYDWDLTISNGGLYIFEVSDPANPQQVGLYALPGFGTNVVVSANYAYVGWGNQQGYNRWGGLVILDVTNPARPEPVNTLGYWYPVSGIALADGYGYITIVDSLLAYDLSDPVNPIYLDSLVMGGAADVAVSGDYAYVADLKSLYTVNISDTENLEIVGSYYFATGGPVDVIVEGDFAYIAEISFSADGGLWVISLHDPANPTEAGHHLFPRGASALALQDGLIYLAGKYDGLHVVDVANPSAPSQIGDYRSPGNTNDVAVAGNQVYTGFYSSWDEIGGIWIEDISDRSNPTTVGFYASPYTGFDVATTDHYAYFLTYENSESLLRIIDASNPADPMDAGVYILSPSAIGFTLANGYAYVAEQQAGMKIIDARDPPHPIEVSTFDTPGEALDIAVSGNYAYIADDEGDLRIIDVSDPALPTEAGFCALSGNAELIAVAAHYAYITDLSGYLHIVDVSDPHNPQEVGLWDFPGSGQDLAAAATPAGDYAFILNDASLRVIDVTDPANPYEVNSYDTPYMAQAIVVEGGYIYLTDWHGGLFILSFGPLIIQTFLPLVIR